MGTDWHGRCNALSGQLASVARGDEVWVMIKADQKEAIGLEPERPSDWSAMGKRITEAAWLTAAVHERLDGQGIVGSGAAVETSRETLDG